MRFKSIKVPFITCLLIFSVLAACAVMLSAQEEKESNKLAPFVPTPMEVVESMLELAEVKKRDVVFDIGCGDGRIVVAAAEIYGARGVGIEYDAELVNDARERVKEHGVEELVTILYRDALTVDLSPATVVTLYLTPDGNEMMRPNLEKFLEPGTRVVSHGFTIKGWEPKRIKTAHARADYLMPFYNEIEEHTLYLYIIGDHKNR